MNLFICRTALQSYIARNLMADQSAEDIWFVFLAPSANEINLEYFRQLRQYSAKSDFFVINESLPRLGKFIESLYLLYMLRNKFVNKRFNVIYFSSITSVFVQTIISLVEFQSLKSFDDGSGNYNYNGSYYNGQKQGLVLRSLAFIFGNRLDKHDLKRATSEHFALDPSKKNIIENVSSLFLKFKRSEQVEVGRGECRVLIGTVYESLSSEPERIIKAINAMPLDYYIPHPRYQKSPIVAFKMLSEPMICEEKVLKLFEKYSFVTVYGFNSTAMMTLRNIQGIRRVLLISKSIKSNDYLNYLCNDVDEVIDLDGASYV